jgi:hypothetical protein
VTNGTNDSLWDAFRRALLEDDVVEIGLGKHQLLMSLDRDSIKATMKFDGRDHDEPNVIRVMFHPSAPRPYQIGGDGFTAADAARSIISTFVEQASARG